MPGVTTLPDPSRDTAGKHQRNHPDTAVAAAQMQKGKSGTLRMRVLRAIAASPDGLADFEVAAALDALHYSCAPRRTELVDLGWVEDSGIRRKTANGTDAVVWRLTERARAHGPASEHDIRPPAKPRKEIVQHEVTMFQHVNQAGARSFRWACSCGEGEHHASCTAAAQSFAEHYAASAR